MSGLVFSLRDALCLQLGRYFKIWDFDQVQFSDYKPLAGLADADMQVTATYKQQKHVLAYKRVSVEDIFKNFPFVLKPIPVTEEPPTPAELVATLNARYGVPFLESDIDWVKTVPKNGEFDVVMASTSTQYTGSIRILAAESVPDIIDRTSTPIHHWPLQGNTEPAVGDEALTAVFDYVEVNGEQWAQHKTPKIQALGVQLPCQDEFTLEFEFMATASVGDKWQGFLSGEAGDDTYPTVKFSWDTGASAKWYAYFNCPAFVYNSQVDTVAINTPVKITIRGKAGRAEQYVNDKLYLVSTIEPGLDAWTHIGKAGQFLSDKVLFRNLKYYDHAIDCAPGQAYAVAWDALTKFRAQPWYWENYGCDGRGVAMRKYNPALLTYGYDYTKHVALLKQISAFPRPWNNANDLMNTTLLNGLRDAMKDVDGNPWVWTSAQNTPFNLYRAAVIYNGPTKSCGKNVTGQVIFGNNYFDDWMMKSFTPPNMEYDNVLVFWLKSTWENNEGYCGCVMLHYNNEV